MEATIRCPWAGSSQAMLEYHDHEWGRPSRDDRHLFELLTLEGAQAGLSWATILNKRENYRRAFDGFEPEVIAAYGPTKIGALLEDPGIVRNRLKVRSVVTNARAFLAIQAESHSFASYLWSWVDEVPVESRPADMAHLSARTELSDRVSKDLKKRGFSFVGSTIIYSYLQAAGLVNDHIASCAFGDVTSAPPKSRPA